MSARRSFLCTAITVLALTVATLFPLHAAEEHCDATVESFVELAPLPDSISLPALETGGAAYWITSAGTSEISSTSVDGYEAVWAQASDTETDLHSIVGAIPDANGVNLLAQTMLRIPLYLSGEGGRSFTVNITLYSALSSLHTEVSIPSGEWTAVTLDLTAWALRTNIQGCEIAVHSGGSPLNGFAVGKITAGGTADRTMIDRYLTFGFTAEGGTATLTDGVYHLLPDRNGTMSITADAARDDFTTQSGTAALCIVLDQAQQGGMISLAVADSIAEGASFTIASTCTIYNGENTYLLPYDEDIPLRAYRLSFHGLYPSGGDSIRLLSVSLVHFDEVESADYAGKISSCAFDAGMQTLSIQGSLTASVAAEYIDAQLALFELPMWEDANELLLRGDPLMTMKISTRFTFTLPLTGREATAAASRYQIAIVTADGTRVPVAAAVYPTQAATPAKTTLSAIGIAGAENADVFASNASSVILDVYADRLLGGAEGSTSGRLRAHGGQYYYLDNAYIRELDSEINFCLAADVEVYLRILCAEDLSARGYTCASDGASYYAFDVHSEAGASALAAVTGFLAERYSALSGFILGYRLDASIYNAAGLTDADAYAELCADAMRLIYNSAVVYIPGIYVVAPIGQYGQETRSGATDTFYYDPVLLCAGISRQIHQDGSMPWGLLYVSDNATSALSHTQNLLAQMRTARCALPSETLLLWQPISGYDPTLLLAEYSAQCYDASQMGVRVMFLSVANFSRSKQAEVAAGLKYALDGTDLRRPLSEFTATVLQEQPSYNGRYVFSDFSRSYSTLGWIAGSGCTNLFTKSLASGTERSLHAAFEGEDGSLFTPVSGNILCVSGVTDNLAYAPYVIYSIQATTQLESAGEAELVFIFGSGDVRAEYAVTVPTGVPLEILCDLTEFTAATTVDFSAITVRCDSAVSLELSRITCYSDNYTSSELSALYLYRSSSSGAQTTDVATTLNDIQKLILLALAAGSVIAVTLFSRRHRETD